MGLSVVKVAAGGLPVTIATTGGLPCTEATNGFGIAVTQSPTGGGLAVTGFAFGPTVAITATSVLETAAVNTTVGTLSVAGSYTGTPVFTLSDSAGGKFNILGTALRTNALLDYETATFHNVTVTVTGTTPATASRTITISVTDVAEPVIALTGTTVNEDAAVNTTVGTLSIANTYTGTPVYTLTDSAGGKFNVSGALLRVNAALDYETATTHSVTVAVSGITPAAANKAFTVVVLDVTEAASTTWNPSDKHVGITLSGGDLIATKSSLNGDYSNVRSMASASSGKKYWEITVNLIETPASIAIGIANGAASIGGGGMYIGNTTNGLGVAGTGSVFSGGGVISTVAGWSTGDTICFALDLDNSKIWFRTNAGNWNNDVLANQNPATNTGGISLSGMAAGPYFAAGSILRWFEGASDQITANFGASAWFGAGPPSGFSAWGGGATTATKNIVTDYGAVGDAQWAQTTLSISTNVLTSATPIWSSGDVGKSIVVGSAGAAGPGGGSPMLSTIAGWTSATQIILADNCGAVLSSAPNTIVSWGTINNTAFANFRTAYQGQTVTLTIPAGAYLISSGNFGGMWDGIRNITVNATGATLCGEVFQIQASAQYEPAGHSAYTAAVTAGATYVTLTTPSMVSRFVVGDYAMMTGLDMQHSGYPTNHALFEYLRITAIDSDSGSPTYGRITFATPLVNSYLTTWPLFVDENIGAGTYSYGGPATLYAMNPKFDHTCVVNGLTVAHHASWSTAGKSITLNNCVIKGPFGCHPTMAQTLAYNNTTGVDADMEVDKLITSITLTNCTWHSLNIQSANSVRLITLDNTDVGTIVGNAWKMIIQNGCAIGAWSCGTLAYGCPSELVVSDSVVTTFATPGRNIQALDNAGSGGIQPDGTMAGGIITIPAAKAYWPGQWTVPGSRLFFNDPLVGNVGLFTITNVTLSAGDLLVHTDWVPGTWPSRTYGASGLWLVTHDCPICTFTNVTGHADVVDLSGAPAGEPMWSYTRRTYDKSLTGTSPSVKVSGKVRKIKVTVATAYTGATSSVSISVFPGWGMSMAGTGATDLTFVVNLKVAGVRELDLAADTYPKSWTGAQSGDTLPALAAATWLGGNLFFNTSYNITGEVSALSFSVEMICDQGLAPVTYVTLDPATATAVTLSGGNLVATNTGTTSLNQGARVANTGGKTNGKFYFESTFTVLSGAVPSSQQSYGVGIGTTASTFTGMGTNAATGAHMFRSAQIYANGVNSSINVGVGATTQSSVIGVAVDLDNRKIWFRAQPSGSNWNGNVVNDPATNVGGVTIPAGTMVPFVTFGGANGTANNVQTLNYGASSFVGTVPAGFTSGWPA